MLRMLDSHDKAASHLADEDAEYGARSSSNTLTTERSERNKERDHKNVNTPPVSTFQKFTLFSPGTPGGVRLGVTFTFRKLDFEF